MNAHNSNRVTATYEHALAHAYHRIDDRGIAVNEAALKQLHLDIAAEVKTKVDELKLLFGVHVYIGKAQDDGSKTSLNLKSPKQLMAFLKNLGYVIPKVRKKNAETREIDYRESLEELALRKMFAEETSARILPLKILLDIRELDTLDSRYVLSKRFNNTFYSCYNVAGTLTGRRSCKKNAFGLGGNAQNFPKHTSNVFTHRFRECLVAREGRIFFFVDQKSAEDWPVSALAQNYNAINELKAGVNRHRKLAAFIFGKPEASITKDSIEYYLGKKSRHASNYRMQAQMMSDQLAKEGFSLNKAKCQDLLSKVDKYDPNIRNVFHNFIISELFSKHLLSTPFGRERYFLGLRNNDDNHKIVNEACAYIPQSTVADNTGFAVLALSNSNTFIVNECHDSIVQEVPDDLETLRQVFRDTAKAFDRDIIFHNGITLKIPIEAELGYDFKNTATLRDYTEEELIRVYTQLREQRKNATETKDNVAGSLPEIHGGIGESASI